MDLNLIHTSATNNITGVFFLGGGPKNSLINNLLNLVLFLHSQYSLSVSQSLVSSTFPLIRNLFLIVHVYRWPALLSMDQLLLLAASPKPGPSTIP